MTVSGTYAFELSRDEIIRRAYQLCGALDSSQSPSASDIDLASDLLGMELDYLQAEGIVLRSVERTTLALVDGTATYNLAANAIDVVVEPDQKAGMVWSTAGSETIVRSITRADYEAISNKTTESTPTMVLIQKLATLTATFWPVPNAAMTFRYNKVRLLSDAATGAATIDLARKWQKPLTYTLSYQLALSKGVDLQKVGMLKNLAAEFKTKAMADERQRGNGQLAIIRYGY
jgi:predicted PhzF superfamily epimerase YddE/YHI9